MKIALVRCFDHDQGTLVVADPPLGLLSLAAVVRRDAPGWEPLLFDQALIPDPGSFAAAIIAAAPDVVGFSFMESTRAAMLPLAHWLRAELPGAALIAGGPGADDAAQVLASAPLQAVFLGEADRSLPRWLAARAGGDSPGSIAGVAIRGGAKAEAAPPVDDLDHLPDPAWDLVRPGDYRKLPSMNVFTTHPRAMPVMTSRGCPHGCSFCHGRFGRRVRAQHPERVLDAWERLERQHGVGELHVWDDAFAFDPERAQAILRGKIARGLRARIAFCNGLRGDQLPDDFIDLMAEAGCWAVSFGIESSSPRVQQLTGKHLDLDKTARAIRRCAERGMFTRAFFMVGFPGETAEEARATFAYALDLPLDWAHFFSVVPFPGTRLAREHCPGGTAPALPRGAYESGETCFGEAALQGLSLDFQRAFRQRPRHWSRLALRSRHWPGFWRANARNASEIAMFAVQRRVGAGLPSAPVTVRVSVEASAERMLAVLTSTEGYRRWIQNPWVEVQLGGAFEEGCVTHRRLLRGLRRGRPLVSTLLERLDPSSGYHERFMVGDFRGTHAIGVQPDGETRCVVESVMLPRFRSAPHLLEWKLGGARAHVRVVRYWMESAGALAKEDRTP